MTETSQRAEALEKRLFALFLEENLETAAEFVRDSVFDDDDNRRDDAAQALFLNFFESLRPRFCEFVDNTLKNPTPLEDHAQFVAGLCYDGEQAAEEKGDLSSAAAWYSAAYGLSEAF